MTIKLTTVEKSLIRRYLLWCYKTTKEELDRIDRKFTQVLVDRHLLKYLNSRVDQDKAFQICSHQILEFEKYINTKEQDGINQKFITAKDKTLKPDYLFLQARLKAIENAIKYFLGAKALLSFSTLYEKEMTRRILESREH